MELAIAVAIVAVGLAIFARHSTIMRWSSGRLRFTLSWVKRVIFGDHIMKVSVVFFAVALAVLTKVFGP